MASLGKASLDKEMAEKLLYKTQSSCEIFCRLLFLTIDNQDEAKLCQLDIPSLGLRLCGNAHPCRIRTWVGTKEDLNWQCFLT